jgi:ubiquinone/menaquinone biosynthesis C-methylase UbiE
MTIKIDQPGQPGEYDDGMQALLQIVWGDGFLSPGGAAEVARLLEGVDLRGASVLDIGCGLGAIDRLLVEAHGAGHVVGIDLEPDLIAKARQRVAAAGLNGRIELRTVDVGPLGFPAASFDVVFSKDSLVQIPDKSAIFAEIRRVLKPGGRFVVSDWLRGGSGPYSAEMLEYFRLEGITYNMASIEQSVAALRAAGFTDVVARDRNAWYLDLARRELAALAGEWYPLIVDRIGAARAEHFVVNWRQLVLVLERGELRPAHLLAVSP